MKVTIAAVGRLKAGAERALTERYLDRANAAGKRLGLTFTVREFPESPAGNAVTRKDQEARSILALAPPGTVLVALDEGGKALTTKDFTDRLSRWRDDGEAEMLFAIGGADGLGKAVLDRAGLRLAFGAMTWPHQFVRAMLAEQFYRAVTILSGHPYHRE
ncbi:MAG: 23S rRNA (pseudouridine(1915)-N(3))-methyltransferase RlmH [Bauldia sp.]